MKNLVKVGLRWFLALAVILILMTSALAEDGDWSMPGSTVVCGRLEQDNHFENGPEPLEWIVLDSDGEKSLLITKDVVVLYRYGYFTVQPRWNQSELRTWLDEVFAPSVFTEEERARLILTDTSGEKGEPGTGYYPDQVFILSEEEYGEYLSGTGYASASYSPLVEATLKARVETIKAKKIRRNPDDMVSRYVEGGQTAWWLRTTLEYVDPYNGGDGEIAAKIAVENGEIKSSDPSGAAGVRPAMWISLTEGTSESGK